MRKLRFKKVSSWASVTQQVRIRARAKNIWIKTWMLGFILYFLKNSKILLNHHVNHLDIVNPSYTMNPDTWILDLDPSLSCWVTMGQFTTKIHVLSAILQAKGANHQSSAVAHSLWHELRLTLNKFNKNSALASTTLVFRKFS